MTVVDLERFAHTPYGTFGRLGIAEKIAQLYTIEDPWDSNRVGLSCIPDGDYDLIRDSFHRGGYETFSVQNVMGRSLIKFHIANTDNDVQGCIGIGSGLGLVESRWAITESLDAFGIFMQAMEDVHQAVLQITRWAPRWNQRLTEGP